MNHVKLALIVTCFAVAGPGTSLAQHSDVLVQQQDGKLVSGTADFDSGQWTIGRRVYSREFDSDYVINNPGFNALASNLPAGTQALPGITALMWDFLPMKIGELAANLFYWDGLAPDGIPGIVPDDVEFVPLPVSSIPGQQYSFTLFDKDNVAYTVDGTEELVPGGVIANTSSEGVIHQHNFFFLNEGSGYLGTPPDDGIYLASVQLRMLGLDYSAPIFFVFGTPGSTFEALNDAAVPWVEEMIDLLVPTGLPGDYSGNGVVDAADYTVWRDALEAAEIELLNDPTPGTVDESDFAYWRDHFGESLSVSEGGDTAGNSAQRSAIPEPTSATLLLLALLSTPLLRGSLHGVRGT